MRVAIRGADGYEVSEDGEVFKDGEPVRVNALQSGYRVVNLRFDREGWRTVTVAQLVLDAFVGPRPATHEARHVDGDPSNCRARNLRWEQRGKNREGRPHSPDTLGHELKDRRRRHRQAKQKVSELRQMKRELARMARELGLGDS